MSITVKAGGAAAALAGSQWFVPLVGTAAGADVVQLVALTDITFKEMSKIQNGAGMPEDRQRAMAVLLTQLIVTGGLAALSVQGARNARALAGTPLEVVDQNGMKVLRVVGDSTPEPVPHPENSAKGPEHSPTTSGHPNGPQDASVGDRQQDANPWRSRSCRYAPRVREQERSRTLAREPRKQPGPGGEGQAGQDQDRQDPAGDARHARRGSGRRARACTHSGPPRPGTCSGRGAVEGARRGSSKADLGSRPDERSGHPWDRRGAFCEEPERATPNASRQARRQDLASGSRAGTSWSERARWRQGLRKATRSKYRRVEGQEPRQADKWAHGARRRIVHATR